MRALIGLVAALATALVVAASAGASSAPVSIVGCVFFHGGHVTVPAGTDVSFRMSWVQRNDALTRNLLSVQTTTAIVDGTPVPNADSHWSAPYTDPGTGYSRTDWIYDTGITLGVGDTLTLTFDSVFSRPAPDGFGAKADGGPPHAGSQFGGGVTCTVTGV